MLILHSYEKVRKTFCFYKFILSRCLVLIVNSWIGSDNNDSSVELITRIRRLITISVEKCCFEIIEKTIIQNFSEVFCLWIWFFFLFVPKYKVNMAIKIRRAVKQDMTNIRDMIQVWSLNKQNEERNKKQKQIRWCIHIAHLHFAPILFFIVLLFIYIIMLSNSKGKF